MNVEKPKSVNVGNEFEKPKNKPTPVQRFGTPGMGVSLWGESPLCEFGSLRRPVYQMVRLRSRKHEAKATAEGRPTVGRKPEPRPARLRTETSYKAGAARRVSQSSRSRSHSVVQVNDELVQGQLTFLSGEVCTDGMRVLVAPASRACPKTRNETAKAISGGAEVSRGHSTAPHTTLRPGRTER